MTTGAASQRCQPSVLRHSSVRPRNDARQHTVSRRTVHVQMAEHLSQLPASYRHVTKFRLFACLVCYVCDHGSRALLAAHLVRSHKRPLRLLSGPEDWCGMPCTVLLE